MAEVNPYAPPVTVVPPSLPPSVWFRREGNQLVIRDGAMLPARCIRTNQPLAEGDWMRRKRMSWTPPWVWLLLLVNLLVLLIVGLCVQKKAWLSYGMSREVRRGFVLRVTLSLAAVAAGLALAILGATTFSVSAQVPTVLAGGLMVAAGAIVAACFHSPLRVVRHRDGEFWLKGVSPAFLDSLDQA